MSNTPTLPGEVIDALPSENDFSELKKAPLIKGDRLKVMRLTLPAEKNLPEHKAPGEITVHCLSGQIEFVTMEKTLLLGPGQLLYLPPGELHSVTAKQDSTVLLTILLPG